MRTAAFAAWFYASLGLIGLPGLPFALISKTAARSIMSVWARSQRALLRLLGAHTEVRGLANVPPGACLIAMKHQSTYDTIAPFIFLDNPAFVLKTELLSAPVYGWYTKRVDMIPIDRDGGAKTMRQMLEAARKAVEARRPIVIFPEGTRQEVGSPPDYKPGVAGLYRALGLPCVPMAVNTGLSWQGSGVKRILPGRMVFEAGPPIPPGLSRDAFMARLESELESATARLVEEERSRRAKLVAAGQDKAAATAPLSERP